MCESTFAMFAIDEPAIFQITQRQTNCHTADVKSTAKLMLTGDGKCRLLGTLENLLSKCCD